MKRECRKCGALVPKRVIINGKVRNCQKRTFCFDCSPFGQHNTKDLTISLSDKVCKDCGKHHKQNGSRCPTCNHNHRQKVVNDKVKELVGSSCWICGYNRCWRALDFHHVDPSTKLFGITSRECMLKWTRIINEIKKCILTCSNCHREIHDGLIENETIKTLWQNKWNEITPLVQNTRILLPDLSFL